MTIAFAGDSGALANAWRAARSLAAGLVFVDGENEDGDSKTAYESKARAAQGGEGGKIEISAQRAQDRGSAQRKASRRGAQEHPFKTCFTAANGEEGSEATRTQGSPSGIHVGAEALRHACGRRANEPRSAQRRTQEADRR